MVRHRNSSREDNFQFEIDRQIVNILDPIKIRNSKDIDNSNLNPYDTRMKFVTTLATFQELMKHLDIGETFNKKIIKFEESVFTEGQDVAWDYCQEAPSVFLREPPQQTRK